MKNANHQSLQWFLNLLTLDLDSLESREVAQISHYAQWHFIGQWAGLPFMGARDYQERELEAREKDATKRFTSSFPTGWPDKETLKEVQKHLRKIVNAFLSGKPVAYKVGNADVLFSAGPKEFSFGYKTKIDPRPYRFDLGASKYIARISLYRLLDRQPRHILGRCRECGKYFIHSTAKPKFFHSAKCQKAYNDRTRRTKDPEAYRAKQREIMRRKYAEKKAKKLGISVEEALKTYEKEGK